MSDWKLESRGTGNVVVERLTIADRYWSRLWGLQFRRPLPAGEGLLLVPCRSIHTMWLRFAIDAAMLDRTGRVLRIHRAVRPWRIALAPRGTHAVLEMTSGTMGLDLDETVALRCAHAGARPPRSLGEFFVDTMPPNAGGDLPG